MNSFSFLFAFLAITVASANPILDCGHDGQLLAPGHIISGSIDSSHGGHGWIDAGHGGEYMSGHMDSHHATSSYDAPAIVQAIGGPHASASGHGAHVMAHSMPEHGAHLMTAHSMSEHGHLEGSMIGGNVYGGHDNYADSGYMHAAEPSCEPPKVLIHQQRHPVIVNRPGTNVVVDQETVVVKQHPVLIKRPPGVIVRPVIKHVQPKPVKVQPVFVRVIRPVEKHFVRKSYTDEKPIWSHTKVLPDC